VVAADRLRRDGLVDADPLFVDEHYDALVVHDDPHLHALLAEEALRPLAAEPAGRRARLEETLAVWLACMGDQRAVAHALHVHPQTVRYRLGRLRQLFGAALDDPRARLRLTLALCWR
jgi:DNA-binding PucR family transcriptional regulator